MTKLSKEVKDAIMDMLKARVDRANKGCLSTYKVNIRTPRILHDNKIIIEGKYIYQNGSLIYEIEERYSTSKSNGTYKMLTPKLKDIT